VTFSLTKATGPVPLNIVDLYITFLEDAKAAVASEFRYTVLYANLLAVSVKLAKMWLLGLQCALTSMRLETPALKEAFVAFHVEGVFRSDKFVFFDASTGSKALAQHMLSEIRIARLEAAASGGVGLKPVGASKTPRDDVDDRAADGRRAKAAKTDEAVHDPKRVIKGKAVDFFVPYYAQNPNYVFKEGECPVHLREHTGLDCPMQRKGRNKMLKNVAQHGFSGIPKVDESYNTMSRE